MNDQGFAVEVLTPVERSGKRQARILPAAHKKLEDLATIGLICTNNDIVAERAFRSLMPAGVQVYVTRTVYLDDEPMDDGVYRQQTPFAELAKGFPEMLELDILAFSCTSGTVVTGAKRLREILADARPEAFPTTPGIGALAALEALGCRRIALATPYEVETHDLFVPFFEAQGFAVVADGTFSQKRDVDITALSKDAWFNAARSLTDGVDADVFYISCTASDVVDFIDELEDEIGIPVVTSTQAMAWHALTHLGLKGKAPQRGRLFSV